MNLVLQLPVDMLQDPTKDSTGNASTCTKDSQGTVIKICDRVM